MELRDVLFFFFIWGGGREGGEWWVTSLTSSPKAFGPRPPPISLTPSGTLSIDGDIDELSDPPPTPSANNGEGGEGKGGCSAMMRGKRKGKRSPHIFTSATTLKGVAATREATPVYAIQQQPLRELGYLLLPLLPFTAQTPTPICESTAMLDSRTQAAGLGSVGPLTLGSAELTFAMAAAEEVGVLAATAARQAPAAAGEAGGAREPFGSSLPAAVAEEGDEGELGAVLPIISSMGRGSACGTESVAARLEPSFSFAFFCWLAAADLEVRALVNADPAALKPKGVVGLAEFGWGIRLAQKESRLALDALKRGGGVGGTLCYLTAAEWGKGQPAPAPGSGVGYVTPRPDSALAATSASGGVPGFSTVGGTASCCTFGAGFFDTWRSLCGGERYFYFYNQIRMLFTIMLFFGVWRRAGFFDTGGSLCVCVRMG
ncbi:hypothetical protein T492DRAFT_835089 [Pavlovales sp. CCMP2436]|nr:hypothetical protein T492DRAFT_835089 [Pavlovales sp. CCMP2436]